MQDGRGRPLDRVIADLPIGEILPQVHESVKRHKNLVLQAQTGAGKTTVVPLEFMRAGLCEGRILVLQPRRIAAIGAARRMAELWGDALGETVGYRIRHDSTCGPNTKVEVITEGILVRMLHGNRSLTGVGCIFFDEFHERNLDSDISFALSLCAQREWNQDLRIVVMSATLHQLGERVARLLGGCPQIFSEGRVYPVEVRHTGWLEELQTQEATRYHKLEERTAEVIKEALEEHEGDALVFLPGEKEIMYTWIFLNNNHGIGDGRVPRTMVGYGQSLVKHGAADLRRKISVMPLYGNLDQDEQDDVLAPPQSGGRKVILATPIAESSLTVPGVRIVIDSGLRRTRQYVPASNMSYMKTVSISKASADQRKGRAGRVAEGTCYRMWHEYEHRHLEDNDRPEIVKEDLTSCILDLAVIGVCSDDEIASLPWIDPPPEGLVDHARQLLLRLQAVAFQGGEWSLLPRGRHLARLPLHPRASHLVAQMRARFGREAAREACNLAALLDERDPLRGGRKQHGVDLFVRYQAVYYGMAQDLVKIVRDRVLSASKQMQALLGLAQGPGRGGEEEEALGQGQAPDKRVLGLMVAWAFPELLAQKASSRVERPKGRSPQISFRLQNGSAVKLDASESLARCEWLAVAGVDGEKVIWACEVDVLFCQRHGFDVQDPLNHEVHDADFAADVGARWSAPARFVTAVPIAPTERRVDPSDGREYGFEEFERVCEGRYSPAAIRGYWLNDCLPAEGAGRQGASTAAAAAAAATAADPGQAAASAAVAGAAPAVAAEGAPVPVPAGAREPVVAQAAAAAGTSLHAAARAERERRVNPEDGKAYTLAQLKAICAGKYGAEEVEEYWQNTCRVPGQPVPAPAPSPDEATVRIQGVNGVAALVRSAAGLSMEQWLDAIDDQGMLRQYAETLEESYDTVKQVVQVYTVEDTDGTTSLDPQFLEDIGVKKLGHRRIFENWFKGRAL